MQRIIWAILAVFTFFNLNQSVSAAEVSLADKQTATYLTMIADGRLQDVKAKLPDLMVERPNDPGVQLLLGVVIDDAFKALDIYKRITDTYPESEWADDAYWRIVQFYAVMGDTTQAQNELNNFRRRYPTSGYLVPAIDVVRSSVALTRAQIKAVVEGPLMTPPIDMAQSLKPLSTTNPSQVKPVQPAIDFDSTKELKENDGKSKYTAEKVSTNNANLNERNINSITESRSITSNTNVNSQLKEPSAKKDVVIANKQEIEPIEIMESGSAEEESNEIVLLASTDDLISVSKETKTRVKSGYFGLQVAAFDDNDRANDSKAKYIQQRMRTEVIDMTKYGGKFSVVIGNYSSKSSAEAAKIIVARQCECDPVIIEK